jgi:hypothetical protein
MNGTANDFATSIATTMTTCGEVRRLRRRAADTVDNVAGVLSEAHWIQLA